MANLNTKACLILNVNKVSKILGHLNITTNGKIAITSVCEYLCAEILELAGNRCKDKKRVRLTVGDVNYALTTDDELRLLFTALVNYKNPNATKLNNWTTHILRLVHPDQQMTKEC